MKNIIKILLCICLLTGCHEKESFLFFGSILELDNPSEFLGHDANWLAISGLNEIYHVRIPAEKSAQTIRKTLGKLLPKGYSVNEVVTIFIYTTNQDTSQVNITFEKVHAMGLVRQQDTDFYLDYIEKQEDRFVLLPELTGIVNAGINMDDLRLFHFASSPGKDMPLVSTIFDFRMNLLQPYTVEGEINKSIGNAFLLNMNLNKGMNTLDIYGENFYAAMRIDDDGGVNHSCGGDEVCGHGNRDARCIHPPAGPGPGKCHSGGGCVSVVLTHAFERLSSDKPPFNVIGLYDFKDSFLMNYPKGRQFVAYMYLTGRYMRMDKDAMNNYLDLILAGEKAIRKIQGDDDNAVIFNTQFVDIFSTFIQNHKNTRSEKVRQALTVLETDLALIKGFTRKQFMQFMNDSSKSPQEY